MRIASVQTYPVTLAVKPAFHIVSSAGAHAVSRYAVVAVRADDGLTGWGEATVVPLWSGESQGGAFGAAPFGLPIGLSRNLLHHARFPTHSVRRESEQMVPGAISRAARRCSAAASPAP